MEKEYQKNFKALQRMREQELESIEREIERLIREDEKENWKEILSFHEIAKNLRTLIFINYL